MAFETLDEYLAFQRKEGKSLGKQLRTEMGVDWTEEKDVWQVSLSCSVAETEEAMELFRKETMQKYCRDPATSWTEFINGTQYTVASVLEKSD